MSRATRAAAILCLITTTVAQDARPKLTGIERAADAILENLIPREDAPFQGFLRLIDAAEEVRATELGSFLLSLADGKLSSPGDIRKLLPRLNAFSREEITGETAHELDIIRRRVFRLLGMNDELAACAVFDGYATRATVIGPFGDAGDTYTGVPFPPEKKFPQPDERLAGRFGPVRTRRAVRPWDLFRINLRDPLRNRSGCFYALHQVVAEADTPCYLRLFVLGSYTLFINGEKVTSIDRALTDVRPPFHIPVVLRKGHNHILIKSSDNRISRFGLRYTDPQGFPLTNIREFGDAPNVASYSKTKASKSAPPKWTHAETTLQNAAANRKGDRRARLLLAAAVVTRSVRENYRLVDAVMQDPPSSPRLRLGLAQLLYSVSYLPAAYRRDRSRTLIEGLGDALGDHFTVFRHRISHREDEDKREDAVRLLRQRVKAGKAGPGTHQRLSSLYRRLGFWAEFRRHESEWMKAFPLDVRPVLSSIGFRVDSGDFLGARRLARSVVERLPGHRGALTHLYNRAAEMGDEALARKSLAAMYPRKSATSVTFLRTAAELERRLGREEAYLDLQEKLAAHPDASLSTIRTAANKLFTGGRVDAAKRLGKRVLTQDPSDVAMRRRFWRLAGHNEFPNIERFRVDVSDKLAKFKPTDRELGASSSLLLDQMIVEVFPDGSSVQEIHTVRRINDLQGVEQFENAGNAASADEVVLLRTIGTDGKSYVPNRVDDEFAMPRVQPGAFIEAIYRSFEDSPLPDPRRITTFYFQDSDAPYLRSEIVLILPKDHKSTIRPRSFPGDPKITKLEDGKTAYVYRVDDSPRLPTEDYLPPIEDLIPMLVCGEDGSHDGTARRYRAGAHGAVFVTPPIRRQAEKLIAGRATDSEKAQAIHHFVHSEIVQARSSSFPTTVLINKKGPRFWLELALLSAADVPYRHGLCARQRKSRRGQPEPFYEGETPYSQSCARVEPRGGKPYWLFLGLPRYYPVGGIPSERFEAEVILFDPMESLQIPTGDTRAGMGLSGKASLVLDGKGGATMDVEVTVRGIVGYRIAEVMRNEVANRKKRFARDFLGSVVQGWTLDDKFEFVEGDTRGPLTVRGKMRRRKALEKAGDDFLLPLPMRRYQLLSGLGGRAGRKLPMQLTNELSMFWQVTVDPGPEHEIVEVPKDRQTNEMLMDYSLRYERDGAKVKITRDFMQRAGRLEAKSFDAWRALLKGLDEAEALSMKLRRRK